MTRYLFWPPEAIGWSNPYLRLFHAAMERHRVVYSGEIMLDPRFLRANRHVYAGVHVHWPERLWTTSSRNPARKVASLVRFLVCLRLFRRWGYRLIWTVHNLDKHEGASRVDRFAYRQLARYTELFIFHSESARQNHALAQSYPAERSLVLRFGNYDGIYPEPNPREATLGGLGIPADRRVMLCSGLLRRYKGVELAMDAVGRAGLPYHLIVTGQPYDAEYTKELSAKAAALENVTLIPREVTEQEFADLHHAADCVVLPYRKITGSSAFIVAATFGRGVITSDLPFFREYIELAPECGELFESGNVDEFRAAMDRYFLVPTEVRNRASRHLADLCSWNDLVAPLAERLRAKSTRPRIGE